MFQWLKLYETITPSSLAVQLKNKPLHDDIIEGLTVLWKI